MIKMVTDWITIVHNPLLLLGVLYIFKVNLSFLGTNMSHEGT